MLVDKLLVQEAKNKLGEKAAIIIAEDLKLKEWDEHDLKSLCPFHSEETPSFIWDGKENANFFKCFGCGNKLNIIDHFMSFYNLTYLESVEKLFKLTDIKFRFSEKGLKADRSYKYPVYESDENSDKIESYFFSRKINKETLNYCDIKQSGGLIMWNFYDENDTLLTVKCRHAREIRKSEPKEWFLTGFDYTPILYNMNKINIGQPLLIVEGQIDCLSVIESGFKNVVSVPGGTENLNWITQCFDWLEQFDKIILWMDNDESGIKAKKEIISRLGSWRCLNVNLPSIIDINGKPTKTKDANDVLIFAGKEKVLDFINNAQEVPVSGVINLADVQDFDLEKACGIVTNIESLDKIIYKFLFGSVVVLTGKKGSGKSSLLNQIFISEPLDQGYDVFCFSGELDAKILKSWIEINMVGSEYIKMKNDFVHVIDKDAKKLLRDWYDGRVWIYDENTNNSDKILEKAVTVTRKYGVKVWILDNLMTLDIGANDTNIYQRQKDFIVKIVGLAQLYDVLIVLVSHPRKTSTLQQDLTTDDIAGSGDIGNLAQYIISVHRFSEREKQGEKDGKGGYKKGKEPVEEDIAVDVLKNRYVGKIARSLLNFNYSDYRFYSKLEELWKRYSWNKNTNSIILKDPKRINNVPEGMRD